MQRDLSEGRRPHPPVRHEALYLPDSPMRRPLRLVAEMKQDLLASRDLAWRLMVRNLRAKYRDSFLGVLWAVIPPVVMALGFSLAKGADIVRIGDTQLPYAAYVMISMTLWQTFSEALSAPMQAWTQAKPMLTRIKLPLEAIMLAKLGETLAGFGVKAALIVAVCLWYDMPATPWALAAPLALLPLVLLGLALGIVLACVGGLYQDVSKGMPLLTLAWLMLTPVVYPRPAEGTFARLVDLNPVTPLLVTVRELATTAQLSDPTGYWRSVLLTGVCLILSWLVLRISAPFVIERMSS